MKEFLMMMKTNFIYILLSAGALLVNGCRAAQDGEPDVLTSTAVSSDQTGAQSGNTIPDRLPPTKEPLTNRAILETTLSAPLVPIIDGQLKAFVDAPTPASRRFDTVAVGVIVGEKAYFKGYKNTQKLGAQPSADTMFEIGPHTKLITALAIFELIRAGKLTLDTPAKDVLSDITLPTYLGEPILVRHLLAHTSGLPRVPSDAASGTSPYAEYSEERLKTYLSSLTLAIKPGTAWEDSDVGYALLGLMVAKLHDSGLEPALKALVTQKVGMGDATIRLSSNQDARLLRGFNNGAPSTLSTYSEAFAGAGALRASTRDMARFLQVQMSLAETTLAESIKKSQEPLYSGTEGIWAAGWGQKTHKGFNILFMKGATPGSSSFIAFSPDKRTGVVILTNNAFSENGAADSRVEDAGLEALAQILSLN